MVLCACHTSLPHVQSTKLELKVVVLYSAYGVAVFGTANARCRCLLLFVLETVAFGVIDADRKSVV